MGKECILSFHIQRNLVGHYVPIYSQSQEKWWKRVQNSKENLTRSLPEIWIHFPNFKILMCGEIPLDNHFKPFLTSFFPLFTPLKAILNPISFLSKANFVLLTHQILIRSTCHLTVGPPESITSMRSECQVWICTQKTLGITLHNISAPLIHYGRNQSDNVRTMDHQQKKMRCGGLQEDASSKKKYRSVNEKNSGVGSTLVVLPSIATEPSAKWEL